MINGGKGNNRIWKFVILAAALLVCALLGLIYGSTSVSIRAVFLALSGEDTVSKSALIIREMRLPRVIGGGLAGAGLGVAGVILQAVMNNSLASPNTIGVNSGAGFFVMLSMLLLPGSIFVKPVMAFLGAMITAVIILFLAYSAEKSRITIVLAGITISSLLSAGMNMLKILEPDITVNSTQFMIGSLAGITMKNLAWPSLGIVAGILAAVYLSRALNLLELGDGVANSLGLAVYRYRILFVFLASLLSGLVVSFAGLIGFVGLIVPHVCRRLFGQDARVLIPATALMGAIFVLTADLLGRVLFAPYELPVGILLSLAGGPFFLYLLMKKGGRRVNG